MNENTVRLIHPVRLRIVSEFIGGPRTVAELAAALPDIPQATLYRHVATLAEAGVLEQVGERAARGPSERVFRVTPGADRIQATELDVLSTAEQRRLFEMFTASLIDSFAVYVDSAGARPSVDGLAANRAVVNLTAAEREDFGERFAQLVGEMLALPPAPDRRRYHLASMVIPAPKEKT